MGDEASAAALRVLTSFPRPRATTNPYIVQLVESLQRTPEVTVCYFDWRTALRGRYDVVHLHWPETWLEGRTLPRRVARLLLTMLLCLRLQLGRVGVVRTWHNLERPEGLWRADYLVLRWLERLTDVRIRINDSTELPSGAPYVTLLHGHYRDWFSRFDQDEAAPGRVAFVGRVRRYKGVEHLLEVVRGLPGDGVSLSVAGLPSSPELAEVVTELAGDDPRVELRLQYVDDPALVTQVTRASLVVLPYRHMHNSGTALAALSLDRPVLVPDNVVNRRLAEEVGQGWVHLFRGDLDAEELLGALERAQEHPPNARPDLSRREWGAAGREHLEVYRAASRGRR